MRGGAGRRPGCAAPPPPPLALTAVYAVADALRQRAWRAAALAPVRDWAARLAAARRRPWRGCSCWSPRSPSRPGWRWPPALWAWRNYAISAGIGGRMAFAPVTFDARQWRRQARAAHGRTAAPGTVPLLTSAGTIPVGGDHPRRSAARWQPVFTLPATACTRHMVIIGATGSGKTNLMIRLWAGWFTAALDAHYAGARAPAAADRAGLQGRPGRPRARPTGPAACSTEQAPAASPIWPDEARVSLWTCRPATWPCCCTR